MKILSLITLIAIIAQTTHSYDLNSVLTDISYCETFYRQVFTTPEDVLLDKFDA